MVVKLEILAQKSLEEQVCVGKYLYRNCKNVTVKKCIL